MVRRVLLGVVAAALFVIGAIALTGTVSTPRHGPRTLFIECGSALAPDTHDANLFGNAEAQDRELTGTPGNGIDPAVTYLGACEDAIGLRRLWAWPLTGLGALGIFGVVGVAIIRRRRATLPRD